MIWLFAFILLGSGQPGLAVIVVMLALMFDS
jgi:hypothetical protein